MYDIDTCDYLFWLSELSGNMLFLFDFMLECILG